MSNQTHARPHASPSRGIPTNTGSTADATPPTPRDAVEQALRNPELTNVLLSRIYVS